MKVLKFGGTSVGSCQSLANVKKISESQDSSVIVVVSALSGVTDALLDVSKQAEMSNPAYPELFEKIKVRHYDLVDELFPDQARKAETTAKLDVLFSELADLLKGISLLHILTKRTSDQVVSFGERLSSIIISELIEGAELYDARSLIKTIVRNHKDVPDFQVTGKLLKEAFKDFRGKGRIAVVPGFISTDAESGIITNLGRGGSDYTASIIASELGADCLEIWTDVDGFMTADPRIIQTSYVINELSYQEAMELCNFGAKVIYPPTLFPVRAKNIPIKVKNTFNPDAPGTVIKEVCERHLDRPVTGISSISDTCLITLSGNSMVGIVGVDGRIFSRLASYSISVFLICQSSSETGISIGVGASDAPLACQILNEEFEHEIATGEINPISADYGLATIAIVGDGMRHNAGLAGKLFSTLGRNGISVIACAQGKDETNISFVVDGKYLRKSINVIHDGFFLSEYQELNLFICGVGTVGGKLIRQIAAQQQRLKEERNLKLNIVGIARSTKAVFDRGGIDLSNYQELLEKGLALRNVQHLRDEIIAMNIFNSVFVDCTASEDVASIYKDLFMHGVSVVAANKVAASSEYSNYRCLKDTARKRGVKFLFETNVGAGLPIINTINDLVNSGDKIIKIEAVVSGTLNFIFNTLSADIPFSQTVRMAKEQGFSEPDPRVDLSGKDVIRKLVILAREAGYEVNQEDVKADLFIPTEFFNCSLEEFWQKLPSLDAGFEERRKRLEAENKHWRFVAKMEEGQLSVGLAAFPQLHSFYKLDGSNNIILLTTRRYNQHPMLIQGYGAGASVTAAGVFADIMSIANI